MEILLACIMHHDRLKRALMNLLSQDIASFKTQIFGVGLRIGPTELADSVSDEFIKFVEPFREKCGEDENAFGITLLSDVGDPLGIYCRIHGHLDKKRLHKFQVFLLRKPNSAPPKDIQEQSKSLGDYPVGFVKFCELLGNPKITCKAELKGFVFDQKKWPLKFGLKKSKKNALEPLKMGGAKIPLKHPDGEIDVLLFPDDKGYQFEVESKISLVLNQDVFIEACTALWPILKSIFKNDSDRSTQ